MGQKIWSVLNEYAGNWVAIDKEGKVIASAAKLQDLALRAAGVTILYAA